MGYLEKKPAHPWVQKCVAHFWSISASKSHPYTRTKVIDLPDGHTEYVINAGAPYFREVIDRPDTASTNERSLVCAQRTRASIVSMTGDIHLFCIRFRPYGIYSLCGQSLHEFVEHAIEPRLIFGKWADELDERIQLAPDFEAKVIIAESILSTVYGGSRLADPMVSYLLDRIEKSNGKVSVHELASSTGKSRRTLEIRFRDQVGLTMKSACRIHRFGHFWRLRKRHPGAEVLQLAEDCGFYDQSHFIREFRLFTGNAPTSFFQSDFDVVMNSGPEALTQ